MLSEGHAISYSQLAVEAPLTIKKALVYGFPKLIDFYFCNKPPRNEMGKFIIGYALHELE